MCLYIMANCLLLATLCISFVFGIYGFSTRHPWLELTTLVVCLLFIGGSLALFCVRRESGAFLVGWKEPTPINR